MLVTGCWCEIVVFTSLIYLMLILTSYFSYSESIDVYMEEEETRYLLPLKEYVAYCESLR